MTSAVRSISSADGRAVWLTIDRPPLNILDIPILRELEQEIGQLGAEPDLQILVLGGRNHTFSAGVSIEDHAAGTVPEMLTRFHSVLRALLDFPTVTVAAISGHCLGGGMELAAACDLRIAEAGTRFGQPEIGLGCFPPFAAAAYPSELGHSFTADLILTGRRLDCEEASRIGFLSRTTEQGALDTEVEHLVDLILETSCPVVRLAIKAIRARRDRPFHEALAESERIYLEELCRTHDMGEGLTAFLQKRQPDWRHS